MSALHKAWVTLCGWLGSALVFAPFGALVGVFVCLCTDLTIGECTGVCAVVATIAGRMLPEPAPRVTAYAVQGGDDYETQREEARRRRGPWARGVTEALTPCDSPFMSTSFGD